MFHFAPQRSTQFHPYGYPAQPSYNPYYDVDEEQDLPTSFFSSPYQFGAHTYHHQHQLEQELHRREQELAIRKEIQRRRLAAQRAAEREHLIAQLEQRKRRERQQALLREQQRRAVIEQEIRKRMMSEEREEEVRHRRHALAQRQQVAEQEIEQEDDSLNRMLHSFLPLLFRSGFQQQQESSVAESKNTPPSDQQPESTPAEQPIGEPLPSSDDASRAPTSNVEESMTTEDATSSSPVDELHQHYRTHLYRRQALSTLSTLSDSLAAQQASFTLPSTLTFQPSPPPSTSSDAAAAAAAIITPKLAFQSSNAPFLAYEDFLVSLLSKIDAVSSGGDRSVKQARKALVKQVEGELKRLDEAREKAWEAEQAKQSAEETEAIGVDDPETLPLSNAELSSSTPSADPPVAPLPNDSTSTSLPSNKTSESCTPLAPASLASLLASSTPFAPSSTSAPAEDDHSDGDSDSTLSVDSMDVASILDEVMRQAGKLGAEVWSTERKGLGAGDEMGAMAEVLLC